MRVNSWVADKSRVARWTDDISYEFVNRALRGHAALPSFCRLGSSASCHQGSPSARSESMSTLAGPRRIADLQVNRRGKHASEVQSQWRSLLPARPGLDSPLSRGALRARSTDRRGSNSDRLPSAFSPPTRTSRPEKVSSTRFFCLGRTRHRSTGVDPLLEEVVSHRFGERPKR